MNNYLMKIYFKLPRRTRNILKSIYCSEIFNIFRRIICPIVIKIKYNNKITNLIPKFSYKLVNKKGFLKLHLGCGNVHLEGYINIDIRRTKATDYVCDATNLPFAKNSVELIEIYHVIEHLPKEVFLKALKKWLDILIPGGKLIIELPDFDKVVKEYLQGNENRVDNIYGLQRFKGDTHCYGYNFKRLKKILEQNGYNGVTNCKPKDYHRLNEPCMRIEACKILKKEIIKEG